MTARPQVISKVHREFWNNRPSRPTPACRHSPTEEFLELSLVGRPGPAPRGVAAAGESPSSADEPRCPSRSRAESLGVSNE